MENLWVIRRRKRMTVSALAAKSGVPADLIREYERGQRPIPTEHLERFARALYVDPWDINTLSDAPPPPIRQPTQKQATTAKREAPAKAEKAKRKPKPKPKPKAPPPPQPARPSQIEHLRGLLKHLRRSEEELTAQLGKSLEELTRREASALLAQLQREVKTVDRKATLGKRRRPYLPESVDEFELRYLTARQQSGDEMLFHLFDGSEVRGRVVGFGPYAITVGQADGTEITLNKLAIAYYQTMREPT
ncbi:MAG TPA: helix-turn-helix transcriptional regulator [Caldilineae bacterium]|nr:helix-turn-helix transcriptional regulator [Caldilineae bacterium]